jgi:hypothetical protein
VMENLKFTYLQGRSLKVEIKSNHFACPQYWNSYIHLEVLEERISEYMKLTMNMCFSTTEQKGWPMVTFYIARCRLVSVTCHMLLCCWYCIIKMYSYENGDCADTQFLYRFWVMGI